MNTKQRTRTSMIALVLFATVQMAIADCDHGFIFYPKNLSVYRNTKIIIESYGLFSLDILNELDNKYPIYLKSATRRIKLNKEKVISGQYLLHQAIFELEELLIGGETYVIEVLNLSNEESNYFNNATRRGKNGQHEQLKWIAKDEIDTRSPKLFSGIEFSQTSLIHYGCGPEVISEFEFRASDESEIFILTQLKEIDSGQSSKYLVSAKETKILVGREMCSGAFFFRQGKRYEIRFMLYDINGNTDHKWTEWLECINPWDYKLSN